MTDATRDTAEDFAVLTLEELDRRVRRELPAVLDWIEALHE